MAFPGGFLLLCTTSAREFSLTIRQRIMPDDFRYDVVLSHNAKDKPRVRRLAERLKAAGVRVWLDEWVIQAGDFIALKVDEGLEQSRVLLLLSVSQLSTFLGAGAEHRRPPRSGQCGPPVHPAPAGDCALPDTLQRCKVVDFREEVELAKKATVEGIVEMESK